VVPGGSQGWSDGEEQATHDDQQDTRGERRAEEQAAAGSGETG
jgi:hypothetical protein